MFTKDRKLPHQCPWPLRRQLYWNSWASGIKEGSSFQSPLITPEHISQALYPELTPEKLLMSSLKCTAVVLFVCFFGSPAVYGLPRPGIRGAAVVATSDPLNPLCWAGYQICALVLQRCHRPLCAIVRTLRKNSDIFWLERNQELSQM